MRKFSLLLCVFIMLSLLGCSQEAPLPAPEATTPQLSVTVTESATEAETEPATETVAELLEETAPIEEVIPETTEAEPEIPKKTVIETKYYTLPLPDHWKETCFYDVVDGTTLTLREKSSYEAFGGGKLCTLMLMPTSDDTYKDFPDYELLCALDTPDGSFYVIALFPTDVQFNGETMGAYNSMAEKLMDVLYSLQPKDGIEIVMP